MAFGYFEALLGLGDSSRILAEATRLKSFNGMINATGWPEDNYQDFVDETMKLLLKTAASFDDGTAILASFNDLDVSSAITYHFRVGFLRQIERLVLSEVF